MNTILKIAEKEALLSTFYTACTTTFSYETEYWRVLALDEQGHSEFFTKLDILARNNEVKLDESVDLSDFLDNYNSTLLEYIDRVNTQRMTYEEAMRHTIRIELSPLDEECLHLITPLSDESKKEVAAFVQALDEHHLRSEEAKKSCLFFQHIEVV